MSTGELIVAERPHQQLATRQVYQVNDPIAVLDTARFEHMQRVANIMANSNLIPESLSSHKDGNNTKLLPMEVVVANCFLVVNQAVRWGMDPFAVAQCVSVVKGKICYEGKLIAGVLDAKLGIRLVPEFEEKDGAAIAVTIYGYERDGTVIANPRTQAPLTVEGTLGDWKTTHTGSPWANAGNHRRMFTYRGAREWTRIHRPALMLGVYTDDEMSDLIEETPRSTTARTETRIAPVPPQARIATNVPVTDQQEQISEQAPKLVETDSPASNASAATAARAVAPPVPPGAKSREATPPAGSYTAVMKAYRVHAGLASTGEDLGTVWNKHVEPHFDALDPEQQDELLHANRLRSAEIDGMEGGEP